MIAQEIAAAIQRIRPGTSQGHAERIANTVAAVIRSELRWLDVYEGHTIFKKEAPCSPPR